MSEPPRLRIPPTGEAVFQTLLAHLDDGLYTVDREGRFTFVNEFIARSSGFPAEAFLGRSYLELIRPEDRERVRENFERAVRGERVPPYELAYHTASGDEMWVEVATAPLVQKGEIVGVLGISRNIQRRKQTERALRESEANYRALVENLPHGVAILRGSQVVFATEPLARILGLASARELQGLDSFTFAGDALLAEGRERLQRRLRGDPDVPSTYTTVLRRSNGEEFDAELHVDLTTFGGEPALQVLLTDISERLRLEEQIRHAQKMEAIGNLAGGIAHDFNNLLTGILATASHLRRHAQVRDAAELIEKSALHAAALTRQLLGFARKEEPQFRTIDVHEIIGDVVSLLGRTTAKSIAVESQLAAAASLVHGDAGQLHQVLMNLYLNACDAMPGGGRLAIATSNIDVMEANTPQAVSLAPGRYLQVQVTDTGRGISESIRTRVFEPFFTTKRTGEGCGMGLAVAYGIVQNHAGAIVFESEVDVGTTFTLHLPLWEGGRTTFESTDAPEVAGKGTILFVDDEEIVRKTGALILSSLGYRVLTASSGAQALERVRSRDSDIDLVVLDYAMPEMDGETCFRELRKIAPDVRVLLSSGLGLDDIVSRLGEFRSVSFLAKPYDMPGLSAAVADALGPTSSLGRER